VGKSTESKSRPSAPVQVRVRTDENTRWVGSQFAAVEGEMHYGLAAFDLRGDALFGDGFD
jgi:hypothetical protein